MQQYEYKCGFIKIKVEVSKEMITYRNKNIPANQIMGVGIGYMPTGRVAVGSAMGGVVGYAIAHGGKKKGLDPSMKLKDIPTHHGNLVIAYQENPENKVKGLNIPINTKEEMCVKMLEEVISVSGNKYKGIGPVNSVAGALGISQKGLYIGIAIFFLIIFGLGIYFALIEGQY